MEDKIDLNQIAADEQCSSNQNEKSPKQEWTQDFETTGGGKGGGVATVGTTPNF